MKRFNFQSAIFSGIVAVIVMTAFMWYFDMNIMKGLGMAMGKSNTMMYVYGGILHLIIGLIFALIYALIFQPIMHRLPGFLSGSIYGILIGILAFYVTPNFMKTLRSYSSSSKMAAAKQSVDYFNVAYGYGSQTPQQYSEKEPPSPYGDQNRDQNDPYSEDPRSQAEEYGNEQQQRYEDYRDQQQERYQGESQDGHPYQYQPNYGSTHGGSDMEKKGLPRWLWVLINHLVYGFVLGLFYRPRPIEPQG